MAVQIIKPRPDEIAREEARGRQRREAEIAEARRQEAKLERELDELEAKLAERPGLPPESPREKRERELEERIAVLEGRQLAAAPRDFDRVAEKREYQIREALRIRRANRRSDEKSARAQAHGKAVAGEVERLEAQITQADRELVAEDQHHAQVVDELHGRRKQVQETLAALLRPLAEDETTAERLAALEAQL